MCKLASNLVSQSLSQGVSTASFRRFTAVTRASCPSGPPFSRASGAACHRRDGSKSNISRRGNFSLSSPFPNCIAMLIVLLTSQWWVLSTWAISTSTKMLLRSNISATQTSGFLKQAAFFGRGRREEFGYDWPANILRRKTAVLKITYRSCLWFHMPRSEVSMTSHAWWWEGTKWFWGYSLCVTRSTCFGRQPEDLAKTSQQKEKHPWLFYKIRHESPLTDRYSYDYSVYRLLTLLQSTCYPWFLSSFKEK